MFKRRRLRYGAEVVALPPEFRFLAACCRWPRSEAADAELQRLAAGVDWDTYVAYAMRHRVEGLAHHALRSAGIAGAGAATGRVAQAAGEIARDNLASAAEAFRLHRLLGEAGLPHLFVKGTTLARLAYGGLALKRSLDIDVLVRADDYAAACGLLARAGYRCIHPGALPLERILRHAAGEKDSVWRHPETRIVVELHQRLTNNPVMLPSVTARSPAQDVEIAPGMVLPTLGEEPLFAYLCVHGALSGWSRLKWAADIAALLSSNSPDETERLYRSAVAIAPGRSAGQALLLCNRLFATPLSEGLAAELRADRILLRLEAAALATMLLGGPHSQLRKQRFGTARVHLATLFLRPSWRLSSLAL
jgi:hypothetical protein